MAEIDPDVVAVAKRWFAFPPDGPRLRVFTEDGRRFLAHSDRAYDLIVLDAYHHDFIPFHLTTREFFQLCRTKLRPGGQFAVNVMAPYSGRGSGIVGSVWQTLGTVFHERYLFPVGGRQGNSVIIAGSGRQLPDGELFAIIGSAGALGVRTQYVRLAADYVARGPDLQMAKILTDDFAPVEDLLKWTALEPLKSGR